MRAFFLSVVVCIAGCAGAGHYGHAPRYAPLGAEEAAAKKHPSSLFGVVSARSAGPGGAAYITVTVRKLEPSNVCEEPGEDETCRVTVSERDFGMVHARVRLEPEDDIGSLPVGAGSLIRLIGTYGQDVDPGDGRAILRADYYRHWPRGQYVVGSGKEARP